MRQDELEYHIGLIFAPLGIASSQDVPFHQPQQLQCLHHGFTEAYVCSPFHSFLHCRIGDDLFWCETGASAVLAGVLLELFFARNVAQKFKELEVK